MSTHVTRSSLSLVLLLCGLGSSSIISPIADSIASCRCFPGDSCWPSSDIWSSFNATIGGRLILSTPIAALCHLDNFTHYDAVGCEKLQDTWFLPETSIHSSSSIMAPLFTNNSCSPFTPSTAPCSLGNYVAYSVNATGAEDYQKTLAFVQEHDIRLVIRNTGHDYNGKSTGAGSVALWTQHLKLMELTSFNGTKYSGAAFKFGAGVLVTEAYDFADSHGLTVVGGNEPTIGLVGGYSQGGGHGPLASLFGLAVDQVLEWEVVLASGAVVSATADSTQYADLFWALSGGGGGTYGAVLSLTVEAHSPMIMSTGTMVVNITETTPDAFWKAITTFIRLVPIINDAGAAAIWYIESGIFQLATLWGPGLRQTDLDSLLQPFIIQLNSLNITFSYSTAQYPSFLEGFRSQATVNVSNLNIGGRLIPRALIDTNPAALTAAIRNITESGGIFSGVSFNVSKHATDVGVNPYWRAAAFDAVLALPFNYSDWDANYQSANMITNDFLPQLELLTPNGAAYMNEADFQQPQWETTFYGTHWQALSEVKSRYDPDGIFYALGAVGSGSWAQRADGRLCNMKFKTG